MKLYTTCLTCKNDIKIASSASTRPYLQMEKGDNFRVDCKHCGKIYNKHINDIKAKNNPLFLMIGLIVTLFVTAILWIYLGAIGTVTIIIPILFAKQEQEAVKAFNSYTIRRK